LNNKKKIYTSPEIEIVVLEKEDVITASGGLINGGSGSGDGGNWGDLGV